MKVTGRVRRLPGDRRYVDARLAQLRAARGRLNAHVRRELLAILGSL